MSDGRAYYNEIDRDAVHVLRSLIADGLIADGDVDDRSIVDVRPDDLAGYAQCHFFAGAGLWSVAARLAGWPDDRPLWTGSCPCQPFSAAGRGLGTDDPRHLWPDFFRLIRACRPAVVMGEQVAGAPGYGWFDGVRSDLAGENFASRTVDIPVCAVDGPHIRQRLYWISVGYAERRGRDGARLSDGARQEIPITARADGREAVRTKGDVAIPLGDAFGSGLEGQRGDGDDGRGWPEASRPVASADGGDMGNAEASGERQSGSCNRWKGEIGGSGLLRPNGSAWTGAEWLLCHDGKARRTEPGIRLLVDGMAGRVPAWRLAGNSISPILAAEVIGAYLDLERSAA